MTRMENQLLLKKEKRASNDIMKRHKNPLQGHGMVQGKPCLPIILQLRKTTCVIQCAGGVPEIAEEDFEEIADESMKLGSTKPRHIKFKRDILDEKGKPLFLKDTEWVLKEGLKENQVLTEVLTNHLYEQAGVPVVSAHYVKVGGKDAQLMEFLSDYEEPKVEELEVSPDFAEHIGADFIFANWDLFKTANWAKHNGQLIRLDNGGALDKRAQGEQKSADDWKAGEPSELGSMLKGPYAHITEKQKILSVRRLYSRLTPDRIDAAMEAAHYPEECRQEMKDIILIRMNAALLWANEKAPKMQVLKSEETPALSLASFRTAEEDDDPEYTIIDKLRILGYRIPEYICMRSDLESYIREIIMSGREREFNDFVPEISPKINPHRRLPMIGIEEMMDLTKEPEKVEKKTHCFYPAAFKFPNVIYRIKGGRLIRRMCEGEKNAFEAAFHEKDIDKVVEAIFCPVGQAARGEVVWSINEPYVFESERGGPVSTEDKYAWILEIYISDNMLQFMQDYAHFDNGTKKSGAFMGNPAFKREGIAGGIYDPEGIPNFLIKREGFAQFWATIEHYHIEKSETYLQLYTKAVVPPKTKEEIAREKERKGRAAAAIAAALEVEATAKSEGEDTTTSYGLEELWKIASSI